MYIKCDYPNDLTMDVFNVTVKKKKKKPVDLRIKLKEMLFI